MNVVLNRTVVVDRVLWFNQTNNQSIIPSTDMIQLTLTLKMTTAQVVETSVTVNNNSPIQDYVHLDDKTQVIFLKPCIKYAELSLRAEAHISVTGWGQNEIQE